MKGLLVVLLVMCGVSAGAQNWSDLPKRTTLPTRGEIIYKDSTSYYRLPLNLLRSRGGKGGVDSAAVTTIVNGQLTNYVVKETGARLFTEADEEKLDEVYSRPGMDLSDYQLKTDAIASTRITDGTTAQFSATVSSNSVAVSNRHLMFTPISIIITDAREIVGGTSPSVTYSVKYGPSRTNPTGIILNSRAVTSTAGQAATPLVTTSIPANSWIWVEVTAVSGTINDFGVTLTYN